MNTTIIVLVFFGFFNQFRRWTLALNTHLQVSVFVTIALLIFVFGNAFYRMKLFLLLFQKPIQLLIMYNNFKIEFDFIYAAPIHNQVDSLYIVGKEPTLLECKPQHLDVQPKLNNY